MAIYSDNFQSYSVGQTSPWGSLVEVTGTGAISNTAGPDGIVGPYGQTQYLNFSGVLSFTDSVNRTSGSVFFNAYFTQAQGFYVGAALMNFNTGPYGPTRPSFGIRTNADGTITPVDLNGNVLGATSDLALRINTWHFFQVNASFANVGGNLQITYAVAVDGVTFISGAQISGAYPTNTWLYTLMLGTIWFSNLTIDVLQPINTLPNPGSPVARVTNQVIELLQATAPLGATCPVTGTATVGVPYDGFIVASGGIPPYAWALTGGSFPPGLTLNTSTGELSGTPTGPPATPDWFVTVTDSVGTTFTVECHVPIVSAAPSLSIACPLGAAIVGQLYDSSPIISGGTGPYVVVYTGTLPPGITEVNPATGELMGTPSTAGGYSYTVTVTDADMDTASADCMITVGLPCGSQHLPGTG